MYSSTDRLVFVAKLLILAYWAALTNSRERNPREYLSPSSPPSGDYSLTIYRGGVAVANNWLQVKNPIDALPPACSRCLPLGFGCACDEVLSEAESLRSRQSAPTGFLTCPDYKVIFISIIFFYLFYAPNNGCTFWQNTQSQAA